jgi:cytochrome c oxidase assembly protein subunit 15
MTTHTTGSTTTPSSATGPRPQALGDAITRPKLVRRWLFAVAGVVAFLVLVGGFTRLSRAGLSIVEWDVVTGVLPPIGEAAWTEAFTAYKQSPEGSTVNADMDLAGFERIFLIEWAHRLLARLAGLFVALPLLWFLLRGVIPWRRSGPYIAIGLLFAFQGFLGWYMVASGLVDRPSVSHLRLSAHLMAALTLLALALWQALELGRPPTIAARRAAMGGPRLLGALVMGVVIVQIVYGAFVAGLKAGHISNTWPLMFGRLVPAGLLSPLEPAWQNLLSTPATVHFVHRWLAFAVLAAVLALWWALRRDGRLRETRAAAGWLGLLTAGQIGLGIATVLLGVALPVALLHQGVGVAVFALAVTVNHGLLRA